MNIKRLLNLDKVADMAVDRKFYKDECRDQIKQTLTHVAKICVFPNSPSIEHWSDELSAFIGILFSWELKEDKRGKVRSKCFKDNFVYSFFNDDFSGYDKITSTFRYAIKREGYNPKDFDVYKLASDNKDRIIEFYKSLLTIPHNISVDEADEMIDERIYNFVNYNK